MICTALRAAMIGQACANKKGTFGRQKFLFCWRRRRDSNPRGLSPKRFSRPPRYDRFDTPAYNCCTDGRAITIPSILLYEFKNEKSNVFTGEGEEVSKRRRSSFCELRRDTFTTKKALPKVGKSGGLNIQFRGNVNFVRYVFAVFLALAHTF